MRPLLCLLAALLMLTGVFAGCLSGKSPSAATNISTQSQAGGAAGAGSNATVNSSVVDDGSGNMSTDMGHQAHMHDYWQGRERVTLMSADINVDPGTAMGYTFRNVFFSTTPGVGGDTITLPDGNIVYEGTGKLEFTATWTDATVTGMGLSYRTAASTQMSQPKDIKSGQPLSLDVTPEMCDMAHSKTSRWAFQIAPDAAGQVIEGTVHIKVDIIRMRDISMMPGHPALFNGGHTLELYKGSGTSTDTFFATQIVDFATKQQVQDDTIAFKTPVPMETLAMTANLTIKTVNVDIGKQTNLSFLVKPASTNRYIPAHLVKYDAGTNTYEFAWLVDMTQTDSPYAKESAWRFDVQVDTDPTGGTFHAQCGGCSNAKVDYDAVITAYDAAIDGAAKLGGGGRGGG